MDVFGSNVISKSLWPGPVELSNLGKDTSITSLFASVTLYTANDLPTKSTLPYRFNNSISLSGSRSLQQYQNL